MTWFIPGGSYHKEKTVVDGVDQVQMVFQYEESVPQTWHVFSALFKGFVKQAGIIIFILMIGGAFWIMNSSRAIDAGILSFTRMIHKLERIALFRKLGVDNVVMVFIMLMFSAFGAIFGMSEETIAFIIIFVPLAISMGYDSITGVSLVFVAAGLGFAGAILNPFTIGIAQSLSGLELFSGIEYRLFCWLVLNAFGFWYILRYARKIKRNPKRSFVYEEDEYWRNKGASEGDKIQYHTPLASWICYGMVVVVLGIFSWIYPETTMKVGNAIFTAPVIPVLSAIFVILGFLSLRKSMHFFLLLVLIYTMLFLIVGVMGYEWYIMEIASLFFAMGIVSGIAMNKKPDNIVKLFLEGVKDIQSAAVIVGLAGGIIIILEDGKVIDTILFKMSGWMDGVGQMASVSIMYVIQTTINLVIPSGSAKAALTMPIMAPFSDLIGVSRQATVMAFQFGDGFTNMITPTSGVLIAVLGVAKIPYEKWVRWIWPFMLMLIILGLLLLIPTVYMKLNGF